MGGRGEEAGKGPATTQTASGYRVRPAGGGPRSTSARASPTSKDPNLPGDSYLRSQGHLYLRRSQSQGPELSLMNMY